MKHYQIETETDLVSEIAHNIGELIKKISCKNGFITEVDSGKYYEVRNFKIIGKKHKENKRGGVRV